VSDQPEDSTPKLALLDLLPPGGDQSLVPIQGDGDYLSVDEQRYITAARAPNTLRGYRSDWAEFCTWCAYANVDPLPAAAATINGYLSMLAEAGAKVGTMSRRLSAIKFAHRTADHPDPTDNARVITVWEGIRRLHAAPPEQSAPLMPPELWDVLDLCPTVKIWKTRGRPPEPDLAGLRDRALLLTGFVGALRRSELSALDVADVAQHPSGLVLSLPRSKTNQRGDRRELVVLPRGTKTGRCPVTVLTEWTEQAQILDGPLFRPVSKGNRPLARRLSEGAINTLIQQAITRSGLEGDYSAHSLRAGFVTYAHLRGASDRAIAHQTRHRSLATVGTYIRIHTAWEDNAATQLGL
jgi:site-specific recombinase XerD